VIAPFSDALVRLQTIPGVGRRTAEVVVVECGVNMSRFPTAAHLASWTGFVPATTSPRETDDLAGRKRVALLCEVPSARRSGLVHAPGTPTSVPSSVAFGAASVQRRVAGRAESPELITIPFGRANNQLHKPAVRERIRLEAARIGNIVPDQVLYDSGRGCAEGHQS
jgi:hypothetical protein